MFPNLKDTLTKLKNDPFGWILDMVFKKAAYGLIIAFAYGIWGFYEAIDLKNLDILHQSIFAVLIIATIFLFSLLASISKYALNTKRENERFKKIIEAYGIKDFFPYVDKQTRQSQWNDLLKYLQSSGPQNLNILALNGWDTFGKKSSPLHEFLKTYQGELRILLIDPECSESELRRSGLNLPVDQFKNDYKNTKIFCEELKANNVDIELKLYRQKPIWKIISTESYMWLQNYNKFNHVEENPVYELYKDSNKSSLYFPLLDVFRKRWHHDDNIAVNLDRD